MAIWALPQLSHQLSVAGCHSTSMYDLSHLTSGKKGLDQIFLRPTLAACDFKIRHLPCAWKQSSKSTESCSASAPNSVSSRETAIWGYSSKDFMSCEVQSGPGKITAWIGEPQDETAHAVSDLPESRWPRRQVCNEASSTSSVSSEHLATMRVSSCTVQYGSHQPHGSATPEL